ncbi:conserved hypothetical protein [Pseudomonas sp. ok272]|uniref:TIGR02285 family protein n=1 Tax=unclassified Pseudomonas TaxID=196821 RepID=UPI0008CBD8DC|nr:MULTISPECIES: TIGR02285 family protein [unclassified Pseudomonas]SEM33276.1 conserved hypothetical protein [Pseudomonas sp. ok272]SFM33111.1 conserved hypothetical protein [Pseudomonas sp. ok602]
MTRHRLRNCANVERFKLNRLSTLDRVIGQRLRQLAVGVALACLAPGAAADDKDALTWLLRDLPPLTIFEGPQKNLGAIDQFIPLLIASMPQYQHSLLRVNRARAMQMLLEPSFTCDPSLVWNPQRAKRLAYSIPAYRIRSNGIVIRQQDHDLLAPFIVNNQVDLTQMLAAESSRLGVVAERSYGEVVDRIVQQAPNSSLAAHYGNDALGSLLQMQRLGRLSAVLGYWSEIRYQALQQGIAPTELEFFAIRGTDKYQSIHVACSNTVQGRQAISAINETISRLRHTQLIEFYAQWLDPQMRSEYREDAKAFFDQQRP